MQQDILINWSPQETRVAIVETGAVQELHVERTLERGLVGNVYLGKVARVLPGMQSAFIDIGLERAAFLHVADLMSSVAARHADDKGEPAAVVPIEKQVFEGQSLLVQVIKDPIGTKGARLSSQISIAGRLLVFLPQDQHIGVSQKIPFEQREALRLDLPGWMAHAFPEVRVRVKLLPNGPPVAYPVQFRVVGTDPRVLRQRADEVKAVMRDNANTRGVNDNWNESVKALRLEVDQDKARALGVTSQSIAQATRTLLSGTPVGQFREGDRLIDMVLRQPLNERDAISDLGNAYVPTASGKSIPLTQIAKPVFAWEPGVMWRENRSYAITVQSDIAEGLQGATVTQQLLPALNALQAEWASRGEGAYQVQVAGAVEESAKGSSAIAAGVPLMLFIIFTLLMLQLHSFSRSLLVFLTGPMGIAGVAAALLALNRPFGFVALLGVVALMGMIQRNAVILIDQIEQDRANGVPAWDAIVEAAVRRLRPIVLTAAAAVLAMIPLSRSVFWGPMAVAIMGGLIVATALTLLSLPAMYAAWFRVRR
jgi:multidrug efflux pump subunit AcrB